jgi:hypothetical protein
MKEKKMEKGECSVMKRKYIILGSGRKINLMEKAVLGFQRITNYSFSVGNGKMVSKMGLGLKEGWMEK